MPEIARILAALNSTAGHPVALATLVQVEGSSYRRPGARLLLLPDGTHTGSISGGCLEEDILERARRVLTSGQAELAVYDTTSENDLVWGVGLGCQGVVRIFIERIPPTRPAWVGVLAANQSARRDTILQVDYQNMTPRGTHLASAGETNDQAYRETIPAPPALIICGAGDDAQPLARMAKAIGWHVTVVDTRAGLATATRFPDADAVLAAPVAQICAGLPIDTRTFVVVMTHRYTDDRQFLHTLLRREIAYLGQLGPRKRTHRLLQDLPDGLPPATALQLSKLRAPVGLDLGGNTPETVALSILAEMQSRLSGRSAAPLRDRIGPIHE
jgi:xanthine/CO dehydrogenase XdhC/CoxF family maturation factor